MTPAAGRPSPSSRPVETLLVTGFLGAGKTTLLRGWLAARPAGARWAVLVNEFGALGVDRALLGAGPEPGPGAVREAGGSGAGRRTPDAGEVAVVEVAGGCACCAARVAFGTALTRLLRRGPWDRLFVETTGLGHPAGLVDQLRAPAFAGWLRVLPPVAVVDASRAALYTDPSRAGHPTALDQVALARLLVLNRDGAVAPAAAEALAATLASLAPWPRTVLRTASGEVPLAAVLDALRADGAPRDAEPGGRDPGGGGPGDTEPGDTESGDTEPGDTEPAVPTTVLEPDAAASDTPAATGGAAAEAVPGVAREMPRPLHWQRAEPGVAQASGWWWPATAGFDRRRLQEVLAQLSGPGGPLQACGLLRGKGVFRTERAWYAWQWVDGVAAWSETAWRADSRLEILVKQAADPQMVEQRLRSAALKG